MIATSEFLDKNLTFRTALGISARLSTILGPDLERFISFAELLACQPVVPGSLTVKTPNQLAIRASDLKLLYCFLGFLLALLSQFISFCIGPSFSVVFVNPRTTWASFNVRVLFQIYAKTPVFVENSFGNHICNLLFSRQTIAILERTDNFHYGLFDFTFKMPFQTVPANRSLTTFTQHNFVGRTAVQKTDHTGNIVDPNGSVITRSIWRHTKCAHLFSKSCAGQTLPGSFIPKARYSQRTRNILS